LHLFFDAYNPNQPLLRNVTLRGALENNGLAVSSPQASLKIQKIAGRFQLAGGNLKASAFALDLLGGRLNLDGTVENIDSSQKGRIQLSMAGISLQALKGALRATSSQSVPVTGGINGTVEANWDGSLQNLMAKTDVAVKGSVLTANSAPSQSFPLNASLHINYDARRNLITVPPSSIQLPATTINARGEVGDHSNLIINASSSNLHQLMLLAASLPSSNGKAPGPISAAAPTVPNLHGAATVNAVVKGTLQNPTITAQVAGTNLQVNQSQWNSLQLALTANPSKVSISNGVLVSAKRGQLNFNGSVGLRRWAYDPSNPIAASLQLRQMSLPDLEQIANVQYPVEGDLVADLQIRGSQLDPQGQGKIQITKPRISGEPVQNVVAEFQAASGTVHSTVTVGSTKFMTLSFTPKTKAYDVKLNSAKIDLAKLHTVQAKNLPLKGSFTLSANGAGTLDNPSLTAQVQMDQLQLRETSLTQVRADLNVADHLAKLALSSGVGQATLRGNATVHLTPGYYADVALDTSKFPLDPILAVYVPSRPAGLHGETELHVAVRGPLADKSKLEAHLTIPTFQASYQSLQLANSAPIQVDYANSVVTLQPSGIKGTGTSLEFQGKVPVTGNAPINVSAHGSIDLRLIQMLSPDLRTGGAIALNVIQSPHAKLVADKGRT
jgi:autotransporter translocation and assembly factor TamB